jgi:hypothetical protein
MKEDVPVLKYLSLLVSAASVFTLALLFYPHESALGNLALSAPLELIVAMFSLGVIPAIFSKGTLEGKWVKCALALAPAVVLLNRLPSPL